MCDLDGVVYYGPDPIAGAAEALGALGDRPLLFATNNASRTPDAVAEHLQELGIDAGPAQVLTSSTTGARVLADVLPRGSEVLAVGGIGVREAIQQVGLTPVRPSDCTETYPNAVLQGYGLDVTAADLAVASYAVQHGARWIATNTDAALPTERGTAPGNGTLVAAVTAATGTEPKSVGKPGPLMYQQAASLAGLRPDQLVGVGDRLETDIAGAKAAGMLAATVLTGVHGPAEIASAPAEMRPDLMLGDLSDLHRPYEVVEQLDDSQYRCGAARARWVEGTLKLEGEGLEAMRAAVVMLWARQDDGTVDPGTAAEIARSSVGPVELRRPGAQHA